MRKSHNESMGLRKITALTGRGFQTISKHVFTKNTAKKVRAKGRPAKITPCVYKRLLTAHKKLVSAKPGKEVTVKQVRTKIGLRCSDRTVLDAFHRNGLYLRPMYEKPEVTKEDKRLRKEFVEKHGDRTPAQWNRHVHAAIDNKILQVSRNGSSAILLSGGTFVVCIARGAASTPQAARSRAAQ